MQRKQENLLLASIPVMLVLLVILVADAKGAKMEDYYGVIKLGVCLFMAVGLAALMYLVAGRNWLKFEALTEFVLGLLGGLFMAAVAYSFWCGLLADHMTMGGQAKHMTEDGTISRSEPVVITGFLWALMLLFTVMMSLVSLGGFVVSLCGLKKLVRGNFVVSEE